MNRKKILLICLAILLAGGVVTTIIFMTEPTATRGGATKETAMLVEVIEARQGTFQPTIVATGSIEPAQDIMLSPRVGGEIVRRSPAFAPGGFVEKGEMLLQIDPADYKNTLELRKSDLSQAIADLNVERGRQDVARRDLELFDGILSEENRELVLRQPQLSAVQARVEAARASVNQAELDLQRTTIRAPFDAHILNRNVNVGSQVSPGDQLGRLVGLDTFWVEVTVPLSKLRWLEFPGDDGGQGSEVTIRNRTAWAEGTYRKGRLFKLMGSLENQTRMARALAAIPDPLGYNSDTIEVPRLIIGAFVEANIQAKEVSDVIRLNRDYIRQRETVWIMEDGKLRIRDVQIVFSDASYAYISAGLKDGDRVIITNLTTVVDGASVRLEGSANQSPGGTY